jgi:hypothetical protein
MRAYHALFERYGVVAVLSGHSEMFERSFVDEDGDGVYERGGKFDRARSNAQARPMAEHLGGNPPYKNWDGLPKSGTPFAYVIVDLAEGGNKRSNVICGTVK